MVRVYLILATRHLLKNRAYSAINVLGLAASLGICLLLWNYILYETSYNDAFQNGDRVYQLNTTLYSLDMQPYTGHDVAPALQHSIPGINNYVRAHWTEGRLTWKSSTGERKTFSATAMQFVDPSFFKVFDTGEETARLVGTLDQPYSVVLKREVASALFGNPEKAIGQTIQMSGEWLEADLTVTGIVNEWPANSTFDFTALVSIQPLIASPFYTADPRWNNFVTFLELGDNALKSQVESAFPSFVRTYMAGQSISYQPDLFLQPMADIHLSHRDPIQGSDMDSLYVLLIISLIILAIAWVNYINLSTARAMERAREVGVRKAIGVRRGQLIVQFLAESLTVNIAALVLGVVIAFALLPVAVNLIGKPFQLNLTSPTQLAAMLLLLTVGTIASGIYPAYLISSFKTTEVIKGNVTSRGTGFRLRQALIVFQLTASLCLLTATSAIMSQVEFMQAQDKGIETGQVLVISGLDEIDGNAADRVFSFKNALLSVSSITNVSSSGVVPGGSYNMETHMEISGRSPEESIPGENVAVIFSDMDFVDTYQMKVIEGRRWNADLKSDLSAALINEAAIVPFGLRTAPEAIGQKVVFGTDTLTIIGVLKNFYWESMKVAHKPTVVWPVRINPRRMSMLVNGNIRKTVEQVEALFREHFPDTPFNYYFADDYYNRMYQSDIHFGKTVMWFAGFAIAVACMGLFGLASFTVQQRSREISIRKVLGASVASIMSLLTSQFGKLLAVAIVMATALSWFAVGQWLSGYPVRMELSLLLFISPVLLLSCLTAATVIIQVYRGAMLDPAKVLKQ
jgi:putative ABC transport system permease protein